MSAVDRLLADTSVEMKRVREVVNGLPKIEGRSRIKPFYGMRTYRGKRRFVVGYSWSRPAATYYGMVYDCVLGYGETFDAALAMAKAKVARAASK